MRLLAVRLQNLNSLNSLSEAHEVRLDEGALSAAEGLITGPTGARKSTLLDAMPRAGGSGEMSQW